MKDEGKAEGQTHRVPCPRSRGHVHVAATAGPRADRRSHAHASVGMAPASLPYSCLSPSPCSPAEKYRNGAATSRMPLTNNTATAKSATTSHPINPPPATASP